MFGQPLQTYMKSWVPFTPFWLYNSNYFYVAHFCVKRLIITLKPYHLPKLHKGLSVSTLSGPWIGWSMRFVTLTFGLHRHFPFLHSKDQSHRAPWWQIFVSWTQIASMKSSWALRPDGERISNWDNLPNIPNRSEPTEMRLTVCVDKPHCVYLDYQCKFGIAEAIFPAFHFSEHSQ